MEKKITLLNFNTIQYIAQHNGYKQTLIETLLKYITPTQNKTYNNKTKQQKHMCYCCQCQTSCLKFLNALVCVCLVRVVCSVIGCLVL